MKIDIARQPLIPAFLTLAVLAAAAMWNADAPNGLPLPTTLPSSDGALAITLPENWLLQFQAAHPVWSKWVAGMLLLFAGTLLGRTGIRYNLYSVSTCLTIPLFGCLVSNFVAGNRFLTAALAAALLTLVFRNFCRAFCNGFGFDAIFRASLYLGLLPLVNLASLPMLLVLPLAIVLFRRTLREATVAVAGLLLPGLLVAYLNWGAGGEFLAPIVTTAKAFAEGRMLALFSTLTLQQLAVLGGMLVLDLLSVLFFLSDIYAVGTKARLILIFNISILILSAATLCGPAADRGSLAMLAVPSAILLPFMMVRTHPSVSLLFYLLLLLSATLGVFLQ